MGAVTWSCHMCDLCGTGINYAQLDKSAALHTEQTQHPTVTRTIGSIRHRDATGRISNSLVGGAA